MINLLKNYKKYSDEKLVPLVVKGNERAFNELYSRYEKKMYRFFYRMLNRDTERANDAPVLYCVTKKNYPSKKLVK